MALFATTVCSTAVIAQVADFVKPGASKQSFDYAYSSLVLLLVIVIWFAKFFFGVAWYRCKLQTNEVKHTNNLFFMRLLVDFFFLLMIPIPLMIWAATSDAAHQKFTVSGNFNFTLLLYFFITMQTMSVIIMESSVYYFCVNRALRIIAGVETESGKAVNKS